MTLPDRKIGRSGAVEVVGCGLVAGAVAGAGVVVVVVPVVGVVGGVVTFWAHRKMHPAETVRRHRRTNFMAALPGG
jgi:Flp pilus assembly protein TadB